MKFLRYQIVFLLWLISTSVCAKEVESSVISKSEMFQVVGGLFLVLLLIVLLSWIVKRFHPGMMAAGNNGFQTIAAMGLGPKERLLLVKVGMNYLLIAQGTSSISLIADYGSQLPDGFDIQVKPSFSDHLKTALGKKDS